MPRDVLQLPGPLEGVAYDSERRDDSRLIIYGQGTCLFVDLSLDTPDKPNLVSALDCLPQNRSDSSRKKRTSGKKNSVGSSNPNFTIFTQYRSIVNVSISTGSELVCKSANLCDDLLWCYVYAHLFVFWGPLGCLNCSVFLLVQVNPTH